MSMIKFRLAAKTDMGLVRTNNEDNFQVAADLASGQMRWVNNEICSLGEKGTLLVVADGMGGMNAGEVASELAIETVREYFATENITSEVMKNRFSIEKYMNEVVVAADTRIKKEAGEHPESRGMGTTIVIGWILGGKLYVSWCGDSRAYIYNPAAGLHQITKDHSYVQSLVDKGSISKEDAFDFPDSNIITRSLCDGGPKAKPESLLKPYDLCDNDIVLLCTDGLNGMIRDREIETVIRNNEHNMDTLVDDLIRAACDAEGSDNVTICLCQILQGGAVCHPEVFEETEKRLNGGQSVIGTLTGEISKKGGAKKFLLPLLILFVLAIGGVGGWYFSGQLRHSQEAADTLKTKVDTTGKASSKENATSDAENETEVKSDADNGVGKKEISKPASPVVPGKVKAPVNNDSKKVEEEDVITPAGNLNNGQATGGNASDTPAPVVTTQKYTVVKGDTYYSLAKKFNTSSSILKGLNQGKDLKVGEVILVPAKK